MRHLPRSRTALPSTMTHSFAIMLALVLIAMATPANAQQFFGDVRTFSLCLALRMALLRPVRPYAQSKCRDRACLEPLPWNPCMQTA